MRSARRTSASSWTRSRCEPHRTIVAAESNDLCLRTELYGEIENVADERRKERELVPHHLKRAPTKSPCLQMSWHCLRERKPWIDRSNLIGSSGSFQYGCLPPFPSGHAGGTCR